MTVEKAVYHVPIANLRVLYQDTLVDSIAIDLYRKITPSLERTEDPGKKCKVIDTLGLRQRVEALVDCFAPIPGTHQLFNQPKKVRTPVGHVTLLRNERGRYSLALAPEG